jgi:hypothetical protein
VRFDAAVPRFDQLLGLRPNPADDRRKVRFIYVFKTIRMVDILPCVVAISCRRLRTLYLSNCPVVTNETVQAFARSCREMRALYLSSCSLVTDIGVLEIAYHCKELNVRLLAIHPTTTHHQPTNQHQPTTINQPQPPSTTINHHHQPTHFVCAGVEPFRVRSSHESVPVRGGSSVPFAEHALPGQLRARHGQSHPRPPRVLFPHLFLSVYSF